MSNAINDLGTKLFDQTVDFLAGRYGTTREQVIQALLDGHVNLTAQFTNLVRLGVDTVVNEMTKD